MKGSISVASVTCYLAHLFELTHGQCEEGDKLLLVLTDTDASNLCQAFQSHIAEHGHVQELKTVGEKKIIPTMETGLKLK